MSRVFDIVLCFLILLHHNLSENVCISILLGFRGFPYPPSLLFYVSCVMLVAKVTSI